MNFQKLLQKYSIEYENYLKFKSNITKELFYFISKFAQKNEETQRLKKLLQKKGFITLSNMAKYYKIKTSGSNENVKQLAKNLIKVLTKRRKQRKNAELIIIREKEICQKIWEDIFVEQPTEKTMEELSQIVRKYKPKKGDLIYCKYPKFLNRLSGSIGNEGHFIYNGTQVNFLYDDSEAGGSGIIPLTVLDPQDCYFPIDYWFYILPVGSGSLFYDVKPNIDQMIQNIQLGHLDKKTYIYTFVKDIMGTIIKFVLYDGVLEKCKLVNTTDTEKISKNATELTEYLHKIKKEILDGNGTNYTLLMHFDHEKIFGKNTFYIFI